MVADLIWKILIVVISSLLRMDRVSSLLGSYSRVSRSMRPPDSNTSICRATSYSMACSTKRNELMFLISVRSQILIVPLDARKRSHHSACCLRPNCRRKCQCSEPMYGSAEIGGCFLSRAHVGFGDHSSAPVRLRSTVIPGYRSWTDFPHLLLSARELCPPCAACRFRA